MVLQKLVQMNQKKLVYLKNQMKKPGYLDEVKSLISEFMQYEVHEEEMDKMINDAEDKPLLQMKLKDVSVLYQAFPGISVRSFYDIRRSSGSSCKRNSVFTRNCVAVQSYLMVTRDLHRYSIRLSGNFWQSAKKFP